MPTTMTAKAQVTIPKAIRDAVGLQPGDRVDVFAGENGQVIVTRAAPEDDFDARVREVQARNRGRRRPDDPLTRMSTDDFIRFIRGDE